MTLMPTALNRISTAYSARMLGLAFEPAMRGDDRNGRGGEHDCLAEAREQVGGDEPVEHGPGVRRCADQGDRRAEQQGDREPIDEPDPRRPVNAATIIRIVAPTDRISSGRMGANRPINASLPMWLS